MDFSRRINRKAKYSPGQWMVFRERFGIPEDEPPPKERKIAQLSLLLKHIFTQMDKNDAIRADNLKEKWCEIADQPFLKKTRPGYVDNNGVLIIFVKDTVWLQEIKYSLDKKKFLNKIKLIKGCDKITDIKFELDPDKTSA